MSDMKKLTLNSKRLWGVAFDAPDSISSIPAIGEILRRVDVILPVKSYRPSNPDSYAPVIIVDFDMRDVVYIKDYPIIKVEGARVICIPNKNCKTCRCEAYLKIMEVPWLALECVFSMGKCPDIEDAVSADLTAAYYYTLK